MKPLTANHIRPLQRRSPPAQRSPARPRVPLVWFSWRFLGLNPRRGGVYDWGGRGGRPFYVHVCLASTGVWVIVLVLDSTKVGASIKKSITWVEAAMRTRVGARTNSSVSGVGLISVHPLGCPCRRRLAAVACPLLHPWEKRETGEG